MIITQIQAITPSQKFWDSRRWPNFTASEFACKHCGENYVWFEFYDRIQRARNIAGVPFNFNSGHRCAVHNAFVGGAPLSEHKRLACDIRVAGHNRGQIYRACQSAGFTGFGFYQTFLHVDLGRARQWSGGPYSTKAWSGLI